MDPMGSIAWLVVGGIAGWLAGITIPSDPGLKDDIVVGIIAGFIGGSLFHAIGEVGLTSLSLWSIFVAFFGAIVLVLGIRLVRGNNTLRT